MSIATLLISSGYAYGKMSRLTRVAFINAAMEACAREGRKASIAQVAAATGLTRAEVSEVVRQKSAPLRAKDLKNRPANVAAGWTTDRKYRNSQGSPHALRFKGGRADFSGLVRKYGGDIPARAMLREMQRIGMVRRDSKDLLWLENHEAPVEVANVRAIQSIERWGALIKEAVRGSERQDLRSAISQVNLHFDSIPQVMAVLRSLTKRRAAFVQGISELGVRGARDSNYSMRINVAVAVARPVRIGAHTNRRT